MESIEETLRRLLLTDTFLTKLSSRRLHDGHPEASPPTLHVVSVVRSLPNSLALRDSNESYLLCFTLDQIELTRITLLSLPQTKLFETFHRVE